ncbi:uncharacterized protein CG5098-like isoform X1 [Agrilus planipennis]|uniref:Uncharacterized protein CG5098-like isoform X1 n=1 Tax=Agrilus planipennis TaxID=224129 RepID=A0A1W4WU19_AGRPL|nr:uncharacterized protein CG5098-like isoform X1 [Agrilus planipennis]XP_018323635.1 uncharacterized protein CG5098-like isoform X1 [Agrilus planipennis]XP_018323643.1 uncharacterized protein CG5098-like isoform X1 [Agrilus planipennis]
MSGGPPHHPHGRQQPTTNPAWNHLQVPNYFPSRQLQHAHMSNEHPLLHQPTWHTPTTEPVKTVPHSHLFNLEQMISERSFQRHAPGVDLSLQRNGSQNGELPTSPISLSVRDTNKINSLPAGAIDMQAVELTKSLSPGIKSINAAAVKASSGSPGLMMIGSAGLKSTSPGLKSASPSSAKSTSPGLKTSSPSLKVASGGHGLLSTNPVIVCTSTNLMMTPTLQTTSFSSGIGSALSLGSSSQMHSTLGGSNLTITPSFFPTFGPSMKATGPLSPGQQNSPKNTKRPTKRVDSIIERLNPGVDKVISSCDKVTMDKTDTERGQGVIVQPNTCSTNDENSNSSSVMTGVRDDEVVSPYSANEDSMDSNKSRRKRKPSKTVKVTKEEEKTKPEHENKTDNNNFLGKQETSNDSNKNLGDQLEKDKELKRRRSGSAPPGSPTLSKKTRRKTSSESETIANIAAMVEQAVTIVAPVTIKTEKEDVDDEESQSTESHVVPSANDQEEQTSISVSVIRDSAKDTRTSENDKAPPTSQGPSARNQSNTCTPLHPVSAQKSFVEVENKLQEMFAGITDETDSKANSKILDFADDSKTTLDLEEGKAEENSVKEDSENNIPSTSSQQSTEVVTSTSNDISPISARSNQKNRKRRSGSSNRTKISESLPVESSVPKKKKSSKKSKSLNKKETSAPTVKSNKKLLNGKPLQNKIENFKDVYAYDSNSNASSSKSRGPFIQIRGPRDSPLSISVINAPSNEEDAEKKAHKNKKYHDDSEYRHKVQSRGLHCSTLSTKYDAQTRDATWICAFCKRGPHATDPTLPGPSPFTLSDANVPPPGDLFGPYIITSNSPEFERRIDDPFDKQFRSKKVARAVDAISASTSKGISKKSKRKHTDSTENFVDSGNVTLGITETKDRTYEVWMHEDCVVWSPGVYLVGSKIVGLEEAIWTCCNVTCSRCSYKGANVCCAKRGCTNVMHIGCARLAKWSLDEDTYRAICPEHTVIIH